eukprot:GHUV01021844.1.p1 GENE.GHUV01021844.1~~GHUV01021844.1.p1  ORF type:complete len:498 (+),score=214.25 GHUV01021844.1:903-2396(+)
MASVCLYLQLAGETLYEARRNAPGGRMDLPTVKAVGLSTLTAIQQVHDAKWIHRDIKPANFVLDPPNSSAGKGSWMLIDFGLVRRYADDSGGHLPQRPDASFRGSTAYASVHAHKGQDLSRRDDLWSWLYMLAELVDGGLPWRPDKDGGDASQIDKQWVLHKKEECVQQPHLLCRSVQIPGPLVAISQHIASLGFDDAPDYHLLRQCLQQLPDHQIQLPDLVGGLAQQQLPQQQHLLNGQQQWDPAAGQQQYQQHAAGSWPEVADAAGVQQQQQQCWLTPESPPHEQRSPASYIGLPVTITASKRPREVEGDQLAKRQRSNGSQLLQQQQLGSPAATVAAAADPHPSSRSGSRHGSREPAAPGDQVASLLRGNSTAQAATRRGSIDRQQQQNHAGLPAGMSVQQQPGTPSAVAAGAAEIVDLLAAYESEAAAESKQATTQAVQQLCELAPTEAVCAIAITLDKLIHQSEDSCRPAVFQIMQDLAAYITAEAAALQKG